jgi:catechol 2,3-dioxygenase-like lactoylglutathione lyase family enzyme
MASLDHVAIYVKDLEGAIKFYSSIFGFSVHSRFIAGESRIAVLDVDGGLLELIQRPNAPAVVPRGRWSHIAFHVDRFDGLVSKLEEMGLALRRVTREDGSRLAFFKDPDGHDREIMERGLSQ